MDHLDIVTGACFADPVTAWLTVYLGGSGLEYLLDVVPGSWGTTRHEGWPMTCTFFAAGNTTADVKKALLLELVAATDGVWVVRITTVDEDVTWLKVGYELLNKGVDGGASLDEKDNLARPLEFFNKLLDRVGALDVGT